MLAEARKASAVLLVRSAEAVFVGSRKKGVTKKVAKLEAKQKAVQEIEEKLRQSKIVVVADYRGLTVSEMNELRGKIKASGGKMKVVKNTLARFAVKNTGHDALLPHMEGPNALMFGMEDIVEPVKVLFDFAKTHPNLEIKVGYMDGSLLNSEQLRALSALPPREVLLARVVGGMQAPLYGLVYVLKANLTGLVRVLDGIREQKQAS